MSKAAVMLSIAVLVSALLVVTTRHESRLLFAQLQSLQGERDALNTEWEKLLLEEATWGQHRRIEETARLRLDMALPDRDRIVVVNTPSGARP